MSAGAAARVALILAGVGGFALLTALGAQVRVPLPATPVPMTLQTLFVLLAGAALGCRLGTLAMGLYLALGLTGWPVFAIGGGATVGYLVGFALTPLMVGSLTRGRVSLARLVAALLAGNAVIFGCGVAGLAWWAGQVGLPTDLAHLLALGVVPFVPGMVLKTLLAAGVARWALAALRPRFAAAS